MSNEIYICRNGWELYDKWVSCSNKKEKSNYRIEFILHRDNCELCTKISERYRNEAINESPK